MARGRGFLRLDNGDGTYTYQKRTASGLVEVSEDEWLRHCKTFHGAKDGASKKRPADDGAEDSQRKKTKLDEVEVTAITLKDGKVIEEKKEKARVAKDGTLHLTDDDGEKLKEVRRVYDLKIADLKSDVEYWTATSNTVEKEKDALEAKVKELEALLANRSNTHEKEKDALKAKIEELEATHAHNWQALNDRDEDLDAYEAASEHNDKTFKKLKEMYRQLQQENMQLKAHLNRLNPQEL